MRNPFRRKTKVIADNREQKGFTVNTIPGLFDCLTRNGFNGLAQHQALQYYTEVAPLATATDLIASTGANIPPLLFDESEKQFTLSDPLLDFLQHPNSDCTWTEFYSASSIYFGVTGTLYWKVSSVSGRPDSEPLELSTISPQCVAPIPSTQDDFVSSFQVSESNGSRIYNRIEDKSGFRYFDNIGNELWQVKTFNPNKGSLSGLSPLSAIFYQIEQCIDANIHNSNALKRGFNASTILTVDPQLTADQKKDLLLQLERFKGVHSEDLLASSAVKDAKQISRSNRDMEFHELVMLLTQTIYNRKRIPLAMVGNESMTFNNLEVAPFQLLDQAVLPELNRLYEELTLFLKPRFSSLENNKRAVHENDIPAIRHRNIISTLEESKIGDMTRDETRARRGLEPLAEGGDVILQPANLIPIAQDGFTDDQPAAPRKQFIESMSKQGLSLKYLEKIADKAGL